MSNSIPVYSTDEERLAAYPKVPEESDQAAKADARERRRALLRAEGWSALMIRAMEDEEALLHGVIDAYEDSQHPDGAPEHFSDRKSKRVRTEKPSSQFWYQATGGEPTLDPRPLPPDSPLCDRAVQRAGTPSPGRVPAPVPSQVEERAEERSVAPDEPQPVRARGDGELPGTDD